MMHQGPCEQVVWVNHVARSLVILLCLLRASCVLGGSEQSLWSTTEGDEMGVPPMPADVLYSDAVDAYERGDWTAMVELMGSALRSVRSVRRAQLACHRTCREASEFPFSSTSSPIAGLSTSHNSSNETYWSALEELRFFEVLLRRAECLSRCEKHHLGEPSLHIMSEELKSEFIKRTPYHYLQLAYFQTNQLDKAAACAQTFIVANPDHKEMRRNVEYYRRMLGVPEELFVDLESRPHMESLLKGAKHYKEEHYKYALDNLETALQEYFEADAECRDLCDGPRAFEGYSYLDYSSDLHQSIADHYIQVLACRQECGKSLATHISRKNPIDDYLPTHYNFLQFSYYKMNEYERAIECTKSFLLFHPDDHSMQQNVKLYHRLLGEEKDLQPRREAVAHLKRSLLEKQLLYFAQEAFGVPFVDPDGWTPDDIKPASQIHGQPVESSKKGPTVQLEEIWSLIAVEEEQEEAASEGPRKQSLSAAPQHLKEGGQLPSDAMTVIFDSAKLNGTQRVVLDGVLNENECRELQALISMVGVGGDGYIGKLSPHTPHERFAGITVYKALKLAQQGALPTHHAHLYYEGSERARQALVAYFQLDPQLYFSYTHLVCREAIKGMQDMRADLSHPVHVDNCLLNHETGACLREHPAYTHRDYSGILYLGDEFEGGNFIFTETDATTVTAEVRPKCGRLVAFSSGEENPHGVRAVTHGRRCAVALWFTFDVTSKEKERIQADALIRQLFSEADELGQLRDPLVPIRDEL
uniref:procollagen-proline 3-dioxygenase n=1 Tax=Eptatretus burgeri TaxID=7764 RepID=A0A8C4PY12_EPTBU